MQQQISIEDFFNWREARQAALRKPINTIEVVVEHDGAWLYADGKLELCLDRDPSLETFYRVSEIENCFIDALVMAGTIDDRLTDDTCWVRKVVHVDNDGKGGMR